MKDYKPINCSFYDELEAAATLKKYIRIQYLSTLQEMLTIDAVIKDLFIKEGAEYMQLNTGEEIRLDRIVSIDGKYSPSSGYDDLTRIEQ